MHESLFQTVRLCITITKDGGVTHRIGRTLNILDTGTAANTWEFTKKSKPTNNPPPHPRLKTD